MKISVFSNEDDWMQIYIDKKLWYDNHISSFDVDCVRDLFKFISIPHEYDYTQDYGINSGTDRSAHVNLDGVNPQPPEPDEEPDEDE